MLNKNQTMGILGAALFCLFTQTHANAGDGEFLQSFRGNWKGSGKVKVNTSVPSIPVECDFRSDPTETSLDLRGTCRALVVVKKRISANIFLRKGRYSGTYRGAGTGPAVLSGSRSNQNINLKIRWGGLVNGDQMANMAIRKTARNKMVIAISDRDPKSGKLLTTSRFNLVRK